MLLWLVFVAFYCQRSKRDIHKPHKFQCYFRYVTMNPGSAEQRVMNLVSPLNLDVCVKHQPQPDVWEAVYQSSFGK